MSSDAYSTTTLNGMDAKLWHHSDSAPVRRLAAALGRDCDAVGRLETDVRDDAMITVEAGERFVPPAGWRIGGVFRTSNGMTYVDLIETDAADA